MTSLLTRKHLPLLVILSFLWVRPAFSATEFNTDVLDIGERSKVDLSRFSDADYVMPGAYLLDIKINQKTLPQRSIQYFPSPDNKSGSQVCLPPDLVEKMALKEEAAKKITLWHDNQCADIRGIKGATISDRIGGGVLAITIPQAWMKYSDPDWTPPEQWDDGIPGLLLDYNLSGQLGKQSHNNNTAQNLSSYGTLGANLGPWRLRADYQANYNQQAGDRSTGFDWNQIYAYRALPMQAAKLTLGEIYLDSGVFDAYRFTGLNLASDERMLPPNLQGYAPEVRGIAKSNAKITVSQEGRTLYETTVAPGPFAINDLYATNYAGDLTVVVTEADGSVSTFTVPFAAVPESIRPGQSRYSAIVGRSRYVGDNDLFSEVTWQHGLTNALTFNLGNQLADGYQAMILGGVYSSWLGAFGMDTTYSHASLPDGGASGWMLHLSYSRTFSPTDTTLSIAGYRYSTEGFRDLSDVLGVRRAAVTGQNWQSDSYRQRSRFEVAVNQGMGAFGSLTMSGSTQDYRDQRGRDNQLQLGWGKTFGNGVALNLSVTRTRSLGYSNGDYRGYGPLDNVYSAPLAQNAQTVTALSLSFPLGRSSSAPSVSLLANHSQGQGGNYQAALSGSVGDEQPVSYGLNFTTDDDRQQSVWGGNLQTRLPYANVTGSFSTARQYRQGSLSLQGAVVAHRGGVTLGPYVGDTFALIEAPGASGARVMDGQGARVDRFGYALAPSLVPYHYNTVALNPEGMNDKAELEDGQRRVAPYAGATVRLRFNTVRGQALLITAQRPDNAPIPMGANVLDAAGNSVGMVGQANQVYLRSDRSAGELTLNWGDAPGQQCTLHYRLPAPEDSPIQRLSAPCR
ncbi:fimbrial biogenesis outer membrane usher protein [Serratia marcescens]|uniref:fimbria/pilus outer membrane usher protein n=3 Tax=Gammaproteobacteria TaxID=1236 RepID=UPI000F7F265F|nr:fimbria/pilus outer membrane usher protein [Serratia marcescens]RTF80433.1 fimbrial biogenesis outer membrane usher protein [Serratia marcescens]RTG01210.1 fimbrial biogenesis outer membrane usher protein [Serratia marcescens]RTG45157.1 fimbrial biogenesis outer membrane usher protein [Serratia marcescens]